MAYILRVCIYLRCTIVALLFILCLKMNVWYVLVFKMNTARIRYDATIQIQIFIFIFINTHTKIKWEAEREGTVTVWRKKNPRILNPFIYQNILYTYLRFDHNQIDSMRNLLMRFNLFCYFWCFVQFHFIQFYSVLCYGCFVLFGLVWFLFPVVALCVSVAQYIYKIFPMLCHMANMTINNICVCLIWWNTMWCVREIRESEFINKYIIILLLYFDAWMSRGRINPA